MLNTSNTLSGNLLNSLVLIRNNVSISFEAVSMFMALLANASYNGCISNILPALFGRSLNFCFIDNNSSIFFASESIIIFAACAVKMFL